jgi:hypothetical protein
MITAPTAANFGFEIARRRRLPIDVAAFKLAVPGLPSTADPLSGTT